MHIFVDFDLILLAIFITIFITGYIRGAGIELLRVLKVVIPFFVLYFYGDRITSLLFSERRIAEFVYKVLPNIPYKNTLSVFSTHLFVYMIVYTFLTIFLWRLGKYVLDERIEYIFGRYNQIFGGIFSIIRMYIIVSVLIVPFYALNYTNQDDPLTNLILNNPPKFSKVGRMIESTKPTIDKLNEVSSTLKIMDLNSLEKYSRLITDVKGFLENTENQTSQIYSYLYEKNELDVTLDSKESIVRYYIENLSYFENVKIEDKELKQMNEELLNTMNQYAQVVIWAYDHDIKEKESLDDIVDSFILNYPHITANTNDPLTIETLAKIKFQTQVYMVFKNWLDTSYGVELNQNTDLLDDHYLELILNDFHLYKDDLIKEVKRIDAKEEDIDSIIIQINKLSDFQTEYLTIYKHKINTYDDLIHNVSFRYKLAFAIIKEKNLKDVISNSMYKDPLYYLVMMDSINFFNRFTEDEALYFEVGQVYIALFLIDLNLENDEVLIDKIEYEDIEQLLLTISIHQDVFDKTNQDVNKILYTLLEPNEQESYLEYLINKGYVEEDLISKLLESKDFTRLLNYQNYKLLVELNDRMNRVD